ncbi:MAG: DNA repair protein RecO [Burkholderiales bacterium]
MRSASATATRHGHPASTHRHEREAGFVLHCYPYSESSLIVETFTRRCGRVPLLAKGARRPRSTLRGLLLQFQLLELSWAGRGELRNMVRAEWLGGTPPLPQTRLFCGFYLNELLLKLLARDDPHAALFDAYCSALMRLAGGEREAAVLRDFEVVLLREIGYAVNLACESGGEPVRPAERYTVDPDHGVRRLEGRASSGFEVAGADLLSIAAGEFADPRIAQLSKQVMRMLIERRLGGRTVATRRVMLAMAQP